ncbi:hypothetical protein IGI04_038803 [Brassica rapa subsp. trilocularis]|nr:hypothetical protein IGI04_038803 [Brassica rapa subsp. trilocularis]
MTRVQVIDRRLVLKHEFWTKTKPPRLCVHRPQTDLITKSSLLPNQKHMAEATPALRKPVFTKVNELRPGTNGHSLNVKVISTKTVMQRGGGGRPSGPQARQMRIAECLVGDETGIIIFTARNDQVDLMKEGKVVTLRNAKIDMYKGSMRLAVDRWGRVEVAEEATDISVKEDNNLSLIEYELVSVEA